ncbi:UxaA family hydrolase [Butyrivibrio sp. YAB3001]|uniref:UxaA family hydrolase n=1 Tax=Butyrivibrio sp. YAB3001 TaxID=1520812 RepID=UPI0008F649EB|nr:altronate dehydratase family protein [Butyrivibrio sp. YAB3001]SFC37195.1 altronate hydrolase [Butyrivibrio sp. YAB3001]
MSSILKIHPEDNVVVCLKQLAKGEKIDFSDGTSIVALQDIAAGHKMAVRKIEKDANIIKYGYAIGHALEDIEAGEWVHTHNTKTNLEGILDYKYDPDKDKLEKKLASAGSRKATFKGFVRKNGKVGIRNEVWIIPTVGCVNNIATALAKEANKFVKGSVDEVVAFTHNYGCSQTGDDQEHTRTILADLINHPNAGGVLVLGLGCENSNIDVLKPYIGSVDPDRVKFLVCQESSDEMEEGLDLLKEIIESANTDEREEVDASKLIIGLKCGGSDGFSGITANPLVGRISDRIVECGGTSILTEVPEMFGAETILMNRCKDEKTFDDTVNMINGFKEYFTKQGEPIYENPSPGNKAGGITTLEDKSLGCTQKSGDYPVMNVLEYGQRTDTAGLNLLCAPGNDLCAATALASSGAQIVLFTTGRGTPFACPVPTMKIASNNTIADKKENWIDFRAGQILEGRTFEELTDELFEKILRTASGEKLKSELAGFHDMAIWKRGVTL